MEGKNTYSYGTAPVVVESDVERMQCFRVQSSLSELISEVRLGRSLMLMGLFVTVLMCASTFVMVVMATNYSKETVIVSGVMTDKATNNVVSTREHEEVIADPLSLTGSQGVKRITVSSKDGSLFSHKVESASRVKCVPEHMDICAKDGFHYLFETGRGTFVGTDNNQSVAFTLVDQATIEDLANMVRPKVSIATGRQSL